PAEGGMALIGSACEAAPTSARPALVRALVQALEKPRADAVLGWLRSQTVCDRVVLLPLEVPGAVEALFDQGDLGTALESVLGEARALPGVLSACLEALASEARSRPGAIDELARRLTQILAAHDQQWLGEMLGWALSQGEDAVAWLAPLV